MEKRNHVTEETPEPCERHAKETPPEKGACVGGCKASKNKNGRCDCFFDTDAMSRLHTDERKRI